MQSSFDSKLIANWAKLAGNSLVTAPPMICNAIKRERARELNEIRAKLAYPDFDDITTENGITWRFYHKCELTIKGFQEAGNIKFEAGLLYGNVLIVRNKEGVLLYVPKSYGNTK